MACFSRKSIFFCSLPVAIGGGIANTEDALEIIERGADKVVINSAAIKDPRILRDLALKVGKQAVVVQIDAKKVAGSFFCATHGAREVSRVELSDWLAELKNSEIGEIHLTSVDSEGTSSEFPDDLLRLVCGLVQVPLIVSGGLRSPSQISRIRRNYGVDAFSFSSMTNTLGRTLTDIRSELVELGEEVRVP